MVLHIAIWEPDTSAFVAAIAQSATALVAFAAAGFAWRQVNEARKTREAQAQPFVVVDVQPGRVWMNWLTLTVENIGATLATNVKIKFNPDLVTSIKDSPVADSVLLKEGIPVLPPGRRIETLFDMSHDRMEQNLEMRYEVVVSFRDYRKRKQEDLRYVIDLSYLYDIEVYRERSVHDGVVELQKMRSEMEKWRNRSKGLFIRRPTDLRREQRQASWQYALTGRYPSLAFPRVRPGLGWLGHVAIVREPLLAWRRRQKRRPTVQSKQATSGRT